MFVGLINIVCVLDIVGGCSKHPKTEETAGETRAGLRFCQSKVFPNLTVLLTVSVPKHFWPAEQ